MKSRRVSWASGVNLCQVVPFLSEDSPSQVGLTIRNNFQSMESISSFSSLGILKKLSCFGDMNLTNQLQQNVSNITHTRWTCPPNYTVSCDWRVTAGEESLEVGTQKLRELNVLEAIYPRVSAIPSSPAVSMDIEQESYDDSLTQDIPLVPIEEMENNPDLELTSPCTSNTETPEVPKQQVPSTAGLDADFLAAASAACAALLKSSEKESMIDPDLLIKIFNDPNLIEQLLNGGGCPAVRKVVVSDPIPQTLQVPYSSPVVCPPNLVANVQSDHPLSSPSLQSVVLLSPGQTVIPSLPFASGFNRPVDHFGTARPCASIISSGHLFGPSPGLDSVTQPFENYPLIPQPIQPAAIQATSISSFAMLLPQPQEVLEKVTQPSFPSGNIHRPVSNINGKVDSWSSAPKDMIYLKNLIRKHGGQNQGKVGPNIIASHQKDSVNLKMGNPLIQEQMNYNNWKTCMFFDSPEVCYGGYNCPFQHDIGPYWGDGRNAKRAKLGFIP